MTLPALPSYFLILVVIRAQFIDRLPIPTPDLSFSPQHLFLQNTRDSPPSLASPVGREMEGGGRDGKGWRGGWRGGGKGGGGV